MALTTVKPSPARGMCRSESNTSKVSVAIRLSASHTFATATTSKPSRTSADRNISRTTLSSSASKTLGIRKQLSARHTWLTYIGSYRKCYTLSVQNCTSPGAVVDAVGSPASSTRRGFRLIGTLHLHQNELDQNQLLSDVIVIADEVDAQPMETVRRLMGETS